MKKEILTVAIDNEGSAYTKIRGNGLEMIGAWLALSDAVARALEEKPLLKGADQRKAMLALLAESFEDKEFLDRRATYVGNNDRDNCKDDGCDGCDDCEHCDSQNECNFYNKAIEQGLSKDEAVLLTLLGRIIGGKK